MKNKLCPYSWALSTGSLILSIWWIVYTSQHGSATAKISPAAVVLRCRYVIVVYVVVLSFQVRLPRFHQTRVPADPCWKGSVQVIVFPRWSHQHTPKIQVGLMVLVMMCQCACVVVAQVIDTFGRSKSLSGFEFHLHQPTVCSGDVCRSTY